MARPIVLDTDIGSDVDDALCLALGLAAPELQILGIISIGHESYRRAQIARKLLELAGRTEIPVFAGCRVPLVGGVRGFNWFGHEAGSTLGAGEEPLVEEEHGVDALIRLCRAHDEVEVVAIGPLTNLAVALVKEPDLAGCIARITIMGGHLRSARYGGHEFAPGVDYNMCSDPHASFVVCRSGIPIRLVPADVTLATWLTDEDLGRIAAAGTELHRVLAAEVSVWTELQKRIFGGLGCDTNDDNVAFLHDPLALGCVYDESFCTFEDLEVEPRIDTRGIFHTIERAQASEASFPMRCATAVDAKAFRAHFTERVLSLVP
jgi:purine nucleosidase